MNNTVNYSVKNNFKYLAVLGLVCSTGILACNGGGGSGGGGAAGGDKNLVAVSHKPDECPLINGEFTQGENKKNIKSDLNGNSLSFEDTSVKFVIDGAGHDLEGQAEATYRGYCDKSSIIIDLFENGKTMGRVTYSTNDKSQLILDLNAIDTRIGQSGKEVWDKKAD